MYNLFSCFVFLILFTIISTAEYNYYEWTGSAESYPTRTDVCVPRTLSGIDWVISVRNSNHGWDADTHRAIITIAINKWKSISAMEKRQMELQLDIEITKSLLRNRLSPIHPNDLVLHIHALIAIRRNPYNFYGHDLVSMLLRIVDTSRYEVHPFLLLALCNVNAATRHHLHYAQSILKSQTSRKNIEYMALALKAYRCMETMDLEVDEALIAEVQNILLTYQLGDGSFGNVYTTSLIVQALATASSHLDWDKQDALKFLQSQSTVNVNMISTYMIQLALHSDECSFIKKLHPGLVLGPVPVKQTEGHFIQYTLRVGKSSDVYFTISLRMPTNATFFEAMSLSAALDSKFNFSYYLDKNQYPSIYSISGVPNDAEGNQYWRLCLQTDIDHNRHDYKIRTVHTSPAQLIPRKDDHVIYWFRDSDCEFELS